MGRFDDLKGRTQQLASAAVIKASEGIDVVESVAQRAGMTKRNGEISKVKLARKVLLTPAKTARTVLDAAAAEIRNRKLDPGTSEDRPG